MKRYSYSPNAWPYYHCKPTESVEQIATRQIKNGFDSFDLLIGPDSFPFLEISTNKDRLKSIREAVEKIGGEISSVVLVGLNLADETNCSEQFAAAPVIADILGTKTINTLPRKTGISFQEGMSRFKKLWENEGNSLVDAGYIVTVENHTVSINPDEDIFLVRTTNDFVNLLDITQGKLRLKFDPAWFAWGNEDALECFRKLLDSVEILDLKDFAPGKCFVTPGTGVVPFKQYAQIARHSSINRIGVEVEEHHFSAPQETTAEQIDALHIKALAYYKNIFENQEQ